MYHRLLRHTPVAAALLAVASPLAAQRITSVQPAAFLTVPADQISSTREITIRGEGITPVANGAEYRDRIRVEARRDGGTWRDLGFGGGGWTHNEISKTIRSSEWLATPGTLEVRVLIDGRPTAPAAIAVRAAPTAPPAITGISTTTFPAGGTDPNDRRYLTYVRGSNYSDPLEVTIGGVSAPFGRVSVDAGEALVWLPRELRDRPGRYPVVVKTRAGVSAPGYVEVVAAPRVTAVVPAEVVKESLGGAGARVTVRFEGSVPASVRVGSDALGWAAVPAAAVPGDPQAVAVEVPASMVSQAQYNAPREIRLELSNAAGSSAGVLTVKSHPQARPATQVRPEGPQIPRAQPVRPPVTNVPIRKP